MDAIHATPDLPGVRDTRSPETRRYDAICDQVIAMNELVKELIEKIPQGQSQTVIHRTEGMGTVGIICATICGLCLLFLILGAILIVPEIHDLNAWKDIHQAKIAKLEAQQEVHKQPN